jgi:phage baseplate assembly protein W
MMNRQTGQPMTEDEHIHQSVADILSTPIGTRIERRDYGSLLPDLIDHPGNHANRLRLQSATVMAILRWEPRLVITSVFIAQEMDGSAELDISATKRTGARAGQRVSIAYPLQ